MEPIDEALGLVKIVSTQVVDRDSVLNAIKSEKEKLRHVLSSHMSVTNRFATALFSLKTAATERSCDGIFHISPDAWNRATAYTFPQIVFTVDDFNVSISARGPAQFLFKSFGNHLLSPDCFFYKQHILIDFDGQEVVEYLLYIPMFINQSNLPEIGLRLAALPFATDTLGNEQIPWRRVPDRGTRRRQALEQLLEEIRTSLSGFSQLVQIPSFQDINFPISLFCTAIENNVRLLSKGSSRPRTPFRIPSMLAWPFDKAVTIYKSFLIPKLVDELRAENAQLTNARFFDRRMSVDASNYTYEERNAPWPFVIKIHVWVEFTFDFSVLRRFQSEVHLQGRLHYYRASDGVLYPFRRCRIRAEDVPIWVDSDDVIQAALNETVARLEAHDPFNVLVPIDLTLNQTSGYFIPFGIHIEIDEQ